MNDHERSFAYIRAARTEEIEPCPPTLHATFDVIQQVQTYDRAKALCEAMGRCWGKDLAELRHKIEKRRKWDRMKALARAASLSTNGRSAPTATGNASSPPPR